jgi:hypothetical protein
MSRNDKFSAAWFLAGLFSFLDFFHEQAVYFLPGK